MTDRTVFPKGFGGNTNAVTRWEPVVEQELEFTAEPENLEEYAAEFLRLEQEMAPLKKRMSDMKKKVLAECPKDQETVLVNGIRVKRTTYASTHFMMDDFKVEHAGMYEQYLEDLEKERVVIVYMK